MIKMAVLSFVFSLFIIMPSQAQNLSSKELDCGIWICLPGGFAEGCEPYEKRFHWRLSRRKAPLVPYSQCSDRGEGSYRIGRDTQNFCKPGYKFIRDPNTYGQASIGPNQNAGICQKVTKACQQDKRDMSDWDQIQLNRKCEYGVRGQDARRYIQVVVDGIAMPKYYY